MGREKPGDVLMTEKEPAEVAGLVENGWVRMAQDIELKHQRTRIAVLEAFVESIACTCATHCGIVSDDLHCRARAALNGEKT